jgi:hypothetical protein
MVELVCLLQQYPQFIACLLFSQNLNIKGKKNNEKEQKKKTKK